MPRRKPAPRMTAAEARAIDREVDRAVARARSSAKAYAKKRAGIGSKGGLKPASVVAGRRKSVSQEQALANYYKAYPKARRSRSVARHLQGLQGVSGRQQKKSPFGGFGLFGRVQVLQGKRKRALKPYRSPLQKAMGVGYGRRGGQIGPAPKPVRRARRRIAKA